MSIVLAVIAVAGSIVDGFVIPAVFAAGAGHVALQQIKARDQRGAVLAYIALGFSYLIGIYGLIAAVHSTIAFARL